MRTDIKKRIITSCYTYNNPFCIQIFYKLPTKLAADWWEDEGM